MERLIDPKVWSALGADSAGHGIVRTRVAPQAPIDIFAAVEHPGAVRLVLFGLPDQELAAAIDIPQATGIEITAVPAALETGWGFAQVRLVDETYEEIFTTLVDDLVAHVHSAPNAGEAIGRLAGRLRRWESFLRVVNPDGLGHERRAGLYGELHILRKYLLPLGVEAAIATWVGPVGAPQDFQAANWALEVKTSRTKQPISLRISGERQLDDVGLAFLGLAHVGLEQRANSGETLPAIVASIRTLLAHTQFAETFENQLLSAGYLPIHERRYLKEGYVVRFDELFRVSEGFPRIIEQHLRDGVGEVAYSVAVSALGPYRFDWAAFTEQSTPGLDQK